MKGQKKKKLGIISNIDEEKSNIEKQEKNLLYHIKICYE